MKLKSTIKMETDGLLFLEKSMMFLNLSSIREEKSIQKSLEVLMPQKDLRDIPMLQNACEIRCLQEIFQFHLKKFKNTIKKMIIGSLLRMLFLILLHIKLLIQMIKENQLLKFLRTSMFFLLSLKSLKLGFVLITRRRCLK